MDTYQNPRLHEWIAMGKQSGKICEARTVVLAYCMDERAVLPWIVDVVKGRMTEENLCPSRIDLLNLIITGAAQNETFSKSSPLT